MLQSGQFDELADYLQGCAIRFGFEKQLFQIGPVSITLSVAPECMALEIGAALASIEPADHTRSRCDFHSETELTVYVLQFSKDRPDTHLQPFLMAENKTLLQLSSVSQSDQFIIRDNAHQVLKVFDLKNRLGLLAYGQKDLLPPWELFSPVKEFIHFLALKQSCLLLHAASLVPPDLPSHGMLIVGPGGSGKSTLTAYGIEQGMLTNGDDYVLVDLRHDSPQCWSVYRTLKLHPSSPILRGSNRWQAWRSDSQTGKLVMLADTVAQGGPLLQKSTIVSVCGVSLVQSSSVHNPKASAILSDPYRHPYLHSCMSTVQQIPYRIDNTLALSKKLHQSIPYIPHKIGSGIEGLKEALNAMWKGEQ